MQSACIRLAVFVRFKSAARLTHQDFSSPFRSNRDAPDPESELQLTQNRQLVGFQWETGRRRCGFHAPMTDLPGDTAPQNGPP